MAKSKIEYNELSKAKVTDSRNIVVSNCSKGGFTLLIPSPKIALLISLPNSPLPEL